jgi:hypothetical protein
MEIAKWSLKYQESAVENLFMAAGFSNGGAKWKFMSWLDTYLRFTFSFCIEKLLNRSKEEEGT